LNKLEFPSHKDDVCQVWLNLASWFWSRGESIYRYIDTYRYLPTRRYTIQLQVDISIWGRVYNVGFKVVIGIH
jgi:hypothetical protein